jgi:carbamate kinase
MSEKKLLVIALGGNAIKQAEDKGTTEEQFHNVDVTAQHIIEIVRMGYRIAVTHGNGPQAGALLIQQEEGEPYVPTQSLACCGAMTQGQIGWMIQNRIAYWAEKSEVVVPVCTVVTQVEVDANDPDFKDPSKPVGPFYTQGQALELRKTKGYVVKEVKPRVEKGWRRVVPSPEPLEIVEREVITNLLRAGTLVVASGGGGIPVAKNGDGSYKGVNCVIDKDRAGFKLAQAVEADQFLILTDTENAMINYNTPGEQPLERITADQAEMYLREGHFLKGSMEPKVDAAIRFARWRQGEAIITSLHKAVEALQGQTGTHIVASTSN